MGTATSIHQISTPPPDWSSVGPGLPQTLVVFLPNPLTGLSRQDPLVGLMFICQEKGRNECESIIGQ